MFKTSCSFVLILVIQCVIAKSTNTQTLQLVTVVFRHGNRTTDLCSVYPKDPYINETYQPYGLGELTNDGKQTEYKLGQFLRQKYIKFLGPLFKKEKIHAVSTNYNRTKMSLRLVLAALYPPNRANNYLNWVPVPYNYLSVASNRLLRFPLSYCPRYKEAYYAYKQSPAGQNAENSFKMWYKYISDNSGWNVTELFNLFMLYFGLKTESEWGLKLPVWTEKVFPNYLEQATIKNYELFVATPQLNQLNGGILLKKVINDMVSNANGNKLVKMYLYSGHEVNVAGLLGAMDLYFPHVPPYGSCIMIELHKIKDDYFVKVFYKDYSYENLREMTVPGCTFVCPLKKFINLLEKNLPNTDAKDPCIL